ncbi:MAG TPA: YggT family protein [Thermotogota bacterium]|nr:YggT family protein [Thermotogota bacterium]HRW93389.1 YggT family protein [Thermotogota bacterium]
MFVLANFIIAIAQVLRTLVYAYIFVIILDSILSFVMPATYSPLRQFISALSNLVLNPIRKVIRPVGGVDLSPFVAILLLVFVQSFAIQSLYEFGLVLKLP